MTQTDKIHRRFMREALKCARKGWGLTSPNPMVGAVVVRDGIIIGRGFHARAGGAHAEINALAAVKGSAAGTDLYVTLEPCSTYGRTPPCTEAIIRAGIRRVLIGATDPNPAHNGRAAEILRQAGIEVCAGIEEAACRRLNEAFFKWITRKMPFVLLKLAMTLDGKIAAASGVSQWITGPAARTRVQRLRQWADAILVGGETARRDRPSLTVRIVDNWEKPPRRLVASRTMTREELATLLPPGPPPELVQAETPAEWHALLRRLGGENVTALLVEGGGELAAVLLRAGVVDKVEFHFAPKILGGRGGRTAVGGGDPDGLDAALALSGVEILRLGDDIIISGYVEQKKS